MSYLVEKMKSIETQVNKAVEEMSVIKKQLAGYNLDEGTLKSEPLESQALNEALNDKKAQIMQMYENIDKKTQEIDHLTMELKKRNEIICAKDLRMVHMQDALDQKNKEIDRLNSQHQILALLLPQ
jgi:chromosome segregation ATPase